MKKVLSICLVAALLLTVLAGCKGASSESETTTPPQSSYEVTAEIPAERIAPERITPADSFAGGDGSEENPYQISNAAELALLEQIFNELGTIDDEFKNYDGKHYILTDDITLNTAEEMAEADQKAPTYGWSGIGRIDNDNDKGHSFKGTFDGQGHKISGIYAISAYDSADGPGADMGLFCDVWNTVIKNVTVADSYFYSYNQISSVGALCGDIYKTSIENCHTENNYIFANVASVGGLIGKAIGTLSVTDCTVGGTVESRHCSEIGGIVSDFPDGLIENCTNNAKLVNDYGEAGGICGLMTDSADTFNGKSSGSTGITQIKGCTNNGEIISNGGGAAGIAARGLGANSSIEILDCTNNGAITGKQLVGGIVGNIITSKNIIDSTADHQGSFTIDNCSNTGEITSESGAGGIVAQTAADNESSISITNCSNEGRMNGATIGGIVAHLMGAGSGTNTSDATIKIENCVNEADIDSETASSLGGIFGSYSAMNSKSTTKTLVKACTNNGNITKAAGLGTGGIVGSFFNHSGENVSLIFEDCTNNGAVNATFESATISFAGGFIGTINSHTTSVKRFINCVNNGDINATVIDTKAQDIKPEDDICYCYAGGITGAATKDTEFINCKNNGKLNLVEGKEKDIYFDDICALIPENENNSFMQEVYKQMSENYETLNKETDD